jgi:hypothetical protein
MNRRRQVLLLFQAAALIIVPLLLEISWSRAIFQASLLSSISSDIPDGSIKKYGGKTGELQIAWLMSFPNSGTSYTSHFVRRATKTRTATNYAEMRISRQAMLGLKTEESIPVYDDQPMGPFWTDGNETGLPERVVLTKTHCGAPCVWCKPEQYTQMIHNFRHRCLRADSMKVANGQKLITKSVYPPTRVVKVVHLIRDPLDNTVSRFRYERSNGRSASNYTSSKEGFREYCTDLNRRFLQDIKRGRYVDPDIRKLIEHVPCHAEILKYVEWHNMAFLITEDMDIDSLILHYEDYSTRFNDVTDELLTFLELKKNAEPPVFHAFKEYRDYFSQEERTAVAMAVRLMALKETWRHVSRYFV